jgi:hypothetical protein
MSRQLVDAALAELSRAFAKLYARDGRPSIPLGRLLRGLLQAFYTVPEQYQQSLGDRGAHCRLLRTVPAFGHSIARRSLDEVPSS